MFLSADKNPSASRRCVNYFRIGDSLIIFESYIRDWWLCKRKGMLFAWQVFCGRCFCCYPPVIMPAAAMLYCKVILPKLNQHKRQQTTRWSKFTHPTSMPIVRRLSPWENWSAYILIRILMVMPQMRDIIVLLQVKTGWIIWCTLIFQAPRRCTCAISPTASTRIPPAPRCFPLLWGSTRRFPWGTPLWSSTAAHPITAPFWVTTHCPALSWWLQTVVNEKKCLPLALTKCCVRSCEILWLVMMKICILSYKSRMKHKKSPRRTESSCRWQPEHCALSMWKVETSLSYWIFRKPKKKYRAWTGKAWFWPMCHTLMTLV